MAFRFFTGDLYDNSLSINSDHIYYVTQHKEGGTMLHCVNGQTIRVKDEYLDVVARLNQRD